MIVKLTSNIPYLLDINGEYRIEEQISILEFLNSLGVIWDEDALVILNGKISKSNDILKDNDTIQLLIPIAGG